MLKPVESRNPLAIGDEICDPYANETANVDGVFVVPGSDLPLVSADGKGRRYLLADDSENGKTALICECDGSAQAVRRCLAGKFDSRGVRSSTLGRGPADVATPEDKLNTLMHGCANTALDSVLVKIGVRE
jgi:hypothetical protein